MNCLDSCSELASARLGRQRRKMQSGAEVAGDLADGQVGGRTRALGSASGIVSKREE
jgi:hypothetical protein